MYRLIFILLILCNSLLAKEAPNYVEIKDQSTLPILSPALSERKILKLQLANGLKAYIISDPNAEQSAAALKVQAGSWEDPPEYPGMAHLVEHMLFLGTKKYPVESEYDRYITEHGGMANAFTEDRSTTYLFSINDEAFEEALDRFSNFFKEPSFNRSGLARELQAIDQEFAKNFDNEEVRQYFVMKEIGSEKHPDHNFSTGNSQTLSKISQETIRNWFLNHYSANLMNLIVYSPLPLEKLKELVVKDFGGIVNYKRDPYKTKEKLSAEKFNGNFIYITPLKNVNTLTLVWELPQTFAGMLEEKPEQIISFVLGDEGPNSLLAHLKKNHLAEKLRSGGVKLGANHLKFILEIDLTEEGVDQIDQVIMRCFQAIANLREKGIPTYLFNDIQNLEKLEHQYPSKENAFKTVMEISSTIYDEDLSTYPEKTHIIQKFDPEAVQQFLSYLTPQNSHYFLITKSSLSGVKPNQVEKWMGVPYAMRAIPKETLLSWSKATSHPEIDLPVPNLFIPENLSLLNDNKAKDFQYPIPKSIVDNANGKVYYANDSIYLMPEVYSYFEIKSPLVDIGDVNQVILTDLYVKSLNEALNKYIYPAQIVGLKAEIERSDNYGISITLSGYNDKALSLFEEIVKNLKTVKPSLEAFETYKAALAREYQNFSKEISLEKAREILKSVVYKDFVTEAQKTKAIKSITYEDFQNFSSQLFEKTFVEGLVYGNVTESQAMEFWQKLNNSLQSSPYPSEKRKKQEIILLPQNKGPFYLEFQSKTPGNAAILAVQHNPFSFQERAAQQILSQAIEEPFYSALRTKQQTGYLVYNWNEELEKQLFTFFADQSNSHNPRDLLSRFELSLEGFIQELDEDLSEERFNTIKNSLLATLERPPKNLRAMGESLKTFAFTYNDFNWMTKRIEGVRQLSYQDCLNTARNTYGRKNRQRFAILVKGALLQEAELHYNRVNNVNTLREMSRFIPKN